MPAKKSFNDLKEEVVKQGGYYVVLYFDIHGNSKEALKDLMVGFVGKLTQAQGVRFGVGEIEEPIEHENMYATTAKVTMLLESFSDLVRVCLNYGPIGVEIEEPIVAKIPAHEVQQALLEVSATSQEFTHLVLNKMMDADEKKDFARKMGARVLLGKKIMEERKV